MKTWFESCKAAATRRLTVALLAIVAVGSVQRSILRSRQGGGSSCSGSGAARRQQRGGMLTLDRAMETLAARVTPAVVNVTVARKQTRSMVRTKACPTCSSSLARVVLSSAIRTSVHMPSQPQNRMEHGLGSGVIISPTDISLPTITSSKEPSIFASP